jgi:hypothetical protein
MSGAKVLVGDMDTGVMTQNHTKPVSLQDLQAKIAGPGQNSVEGDQVGLDSEHVNLTLNVRS